MPDWKFFRDREGNGYYYDRALKIRITDENPFDYTPASVSGNDYYLNRGIEYIKEGKYPEGLFYLKSLRTLPPGNLRVERNTAEAVKWINFLQKKHGERFNRFDRECTLLVNYSEDRYNIINEKLRYKITISRKPQIIKAAWKLNGMGYGLKYGFNLDHKNSDPGYDCVTGVETRILKGKTLSVSDAENSWANELGRDNFKRTVILRKEDRVVYLYSYNDGVPFSGIEGIYINGNIIHIIRVLCSSTIQENVFSEVRKEIEEMVLVRH